MASKAARQGYNSQTLEMRGVMRNRFLYRLMRAAIRAYSQLLFKMRVHWLAPLPPGRKLIAANHPSCTDPFVIPLLTQVEISILITGKAFSVPLFSGLLRRCGQIPVVEGSGRDALEEARLHLESGGTVAIFPEGHLSPQEGGHLPARPGAVRLAMLTGAPIIPVGIHYPREKNVRISSKITGGEQSDGYWYLTGPYQLTVGEPMYFSGDPDDREQVDTASALLMDRIAFLAEESRLRMHRLIPAPVTVD
jgi:1-acyl-sn-glycerol-3-phosphate acyltransferase